MSPAADTGMKNLDAVAAWAYRSLALTFFFLAMMRLIFGDGGWFNEAMVAGLLTLPLVVRRMGRRRKAA